MNEPQMNTDQHGNNPCYSVFFRGLFTRVIPCFSVAYLPVLFRVFPWLIHPCYSVFFRGLVCGFTFWLK